jgi:hypothetical protein
MGAPLADVLALSRGACETGAVEVTRLGAAAGLPGDRPRVERFAAVGAHRDHLHEASTAVVANPQRRAVRRRPLVTPLTQRRQGVPQIAGPALDHAVLDQVTEPLVEDVARGVHHSPTTPRHCATEQLTSSKLVRCTTATELSSMIERGTRSRIAHRQELRRLRPEAADVR